MSARERLRIMVGTDPGSRTVWSLEEVERALDAHAHELAEQIRDFPWAVGCAAGCCDDERGAEKAADLIDPEVPSNG